MGKNNLIIVLGIFIALLPYLGFPQKLKTFLFVFVGLLISLLAYRIGRRMMKLGVKDDQFKDNNFDQPLN